MSEETDQEVSLENIEPLRKKGLSYSSIGEKLNTSASTVMRRIHDAERDDLKYLAKESDINNLSKEDASYIAGLIDGEGCLSLLSQEYGSHEGMSITPSIQVAMASEKTIDYLVKKTGLDKKSERFHEKENLKNQWVYRLHSRKDVLSLLTQISPYLIEKKDQADKIIEYCKNRKDNKPYTQHEKKLVRDVKGLNS